MSTPRSQKPGSAAVISMLNGADAVEADVVITGGGVGHIHRLAIDANREGG